ncbi:hypothetical protein [Paraburkholderia sp. BL9I2N2]|uniref:hypothetical protein n=1 Tax=Paraburkholderia sp. BL9I2N2 TaxID=1938809 RepID=UPI00104AB89A|nr:hypothetical protein [Paraburkholderia sp. BL9I2N2]TCK96234.1 hypothetical protein B0G74_2893 [Paraburkholderia sp. BL9I2N2]
MDDKYIISIFSALVGAFVAIFTNFWRTRYTIRAQDFSKRIEEIAQSISKLETYACEYWVCTDREKTNVNYYVIGMQTKIELMVQYLNEQYKEFDKPMILGSLNEFTTACTGGTFGSKSGSPEPNRVQIILVRGETVKIELMKIRNQQY